VSAALRAALEAALAADPDDLAAHMAYADLLAEQGDPRGEFIRLQLARERGEGDERREAELLAAHREGWFGALAPHRPAAGESVNFNVEWRRGWIDTLDVYYLEPPLAEALTAAPELRLMRHLRIFNMSAQVPLADANPFHMFGDLEPAEEEGEHNSCLAPLAGSPNLANVRHFLVGGDELPDDPDGIEYPWAPNAMPEVSGVGVFEMVRAMPRLEELRIIARGVDTGQLFRLNSLDSLRILQVYDGSHYPLHWIADNPALRRLTHLLLQARRCYPGEQAHLHLGAVRYLLRSPNLPALTHLSLRMSSLGDAGVDEIIASGILRRLTVLDLRYGQVTDRGAERLAACVETRKLQRLVLSNNNLSGRGLQRGKAAGVSLVAEELGHGTDLFENDME
jgi:uncharacterized protein (TIGR02996 family)